MKLNYTKILFVAIVAASIIFTSCKKENEVNLDNSTSVEKDLGTKTINSNQSQTLITSTTNAYTYDLIAGQNILVGNIVVKYDVNNVYVEYNTFGDWKLYETHVWAGDNLANLPKTKTGNPQIGKFPYNSGALNGLNYYLVTIPLNTLTTATDYCNKIFYVAAHAVVKKIENGTITQTETAWGNGPQITTGGSWAMYFSFTNVCDNGGGDDEITCETAFGYGSQTFVDAALTQNRWGWIITINQPGTYETPIYAGVGLNNISNGTEVGKLLYAYDGTKLTVKYELYSGFGLDETHLYASTSFPTTIAPGQYGNIHDLTNASNDTYEINISGGPIYIIAHGVVCSNAW